MVAGWWKFMVDGRRTLLVEVATGGRCGGGKGRRADRAWATGHPAGTVEAMGDRPARRK